MELFIRILFSYILGILLLFYILNRLADGTIRDKKTKEIFPVGSKEYMIWSIYASIIWPVTVIDIISKIIQNKAKED